MDESKDPFLEGRRLRMALREARTQAGLTQRDVAHAFDWSPSKVVRIESGDHSVSVPDLMALLELYGVHDQERVAQLVHMARSSRRQLWAAYRDVFPREFLVYLSFEGSASRIRSFEPTLIPGLLQTEEYARAVSRAFTDPDVSPSVIDRRIEARLQRQELLDRENGPEIHFILDEAAIRRRVGGRSMLMYDQLMLLRTVATRPKVTIQILPFSAGEHPGMAGSFVYLEFPGPGDGDLVFLERARSDLITRDSMEDTQRYLEYFLALEELAAAPGSLVEIIDDVLEEMYGASREVA